MAETDTARHPTADAVKAATDMIHAVRGSIRTATADGLAAAHPAAPAEVIDFVATVAAVLRLQDQEEVGHEVSDDQIKGLVDRLYEAAARFGAWGDLARLEVIADLLELLTGYDLHWFGSSLIDQLPELDLGELSRDDASAAAACLSTVVSYQIGQFLDQQEWDDDALDLLEVARALSAIRADDEILLEALVDGLRHAATLECWEIMTPIRREELGNEASRSGLEEAVAELAEQIELPEFVSLAVHLLSHDLIASGSLAADLTSRQLALVAFAFLYEVDNEETFEGPNLLAWADLDESAYRSLREAAESVLEWDPDEGDAFARQCVRWRVSSLDPGLVPSRFITPGDEPLELDAGGRDAFLVELEEQAWLMIHPGEVLQFLLERFDADDPDVFADDFLDRAVAVWKRASPVVRQLLAERPDLEGQLTLR